MDFVACIAAYDIAPRAEIVGLLDNVKTDTISKLTQYIDIRIGEIANRINSLVDTVSQKLTDLESKLGHIDNLTNRLGHLDYEIAQIRDTVAKPVSNVTAECVRAIQDTCFDRIKSALANNTRKQVESKFDTLRERLTKDCELVANNAAHTISINMLETHTMPRVMHALESGIANMTAKCVDLETCMKTTLLPYERVIGGPNYDRGRDRMTTASLMLDRSWGKSELVASGDGIIVDSPIGRVMSAVMEDRRGTALRVPGTMTATPDGVVAIAGMYTPMLTGKNIAISGGIRVGPYTPVQSDANGVCITLPTDAPLSNMYTADRKIGLAGKPIVSDKQTRLALIDTSNAGIEQDGSIFGKSCRVKSIETNVIKPIQKGDTICIDGNARFDKLDVGQVRLTGEGFVLPLLEELPKNAPEGSICLTCDGMKARLRNVWVPVS
jgi:hypothetical protein